MKDIRKQLLAAFDVEHREHLHAIRSALDAAGIGNVDLADVFRRAHSLKGAARAVELPAVEEVAHRLEAIFSELLEEKKSLDPATVAAVRLSLDTIEDLVAQVDTPGNQPTRQARVKVVEHPLEQDQPVGVPGSGAAVESPDFTEAGYVCRVRPRIWFLSAGGLRSDGAIVELDASVAGRDTGRRGDRRRPA